MSKKKTGIVTEESRSERNVLIGVRWNEAFPELVIAYCDEESLRELIGTPSIIGIGFSSREATVAVIPNSSSRDADTKNTLEKPAFRREDDYRVSRWPGQALRNSVGLKDTRRIACAALQHAIAAGILLCCSRSILGAAIRALVGG